METQAKLNREEKYGCLLVVLYFCIFLIIGSIWFFIPNTANYKLTFQSGAYLIAGILTGYFSKYLGKKELWPISSLILLVAALHFINALKAAELIFAASVAVGFLLLFLLGKTYGAKLVMNRTNGTFVIIGVIFILLIAVTGSIRIIDYIRPSVSIRESKSKAMYIKKCQAQQSKMILNNVPIEFKEGWLEGRTGIEISFFNFRKVYIVGSNLLCFTLKNNNQEINMQKIHFQMVYENNFKRGSSLGRGNEQVYFFLVDKKKNRFLISIQQGDLNKEIYFSPEKKGDEI